VLELAFRDGKGMNCGFCEKRKRAKAGLKGGVRSTEEGQRPRLPLVIQRMERTRSSSGGEKLEISRTKLERKRRVQGHWLVS